MWGKNTCIEGFCPQYSSESAPKSSENSKGIFQELLSAHIVHIHMESKHTLKCSLFPWGLNDRRLTLALVQGHPGNLYYGGTKRGSQENQLTSYSLPTSVLFNPFIFWEVLKCLAIHCSFSPGLFHCQRCLFVFKTDLKQLICCSCAKPLKYIF